MQGTSFRLVVLGERLAVARLPRDAAIPTWARGAFVTVSRTPSELSVTCAQSHVPRDVACERDLVALSIDATLPMSAVGILAGLCAALAAARVPVFAISTHDTDWLLVPAARLADARQALEAAGHAVSGASLPE